MWLDYRFKQLNYDGTFAYNPAVEVAMPAPEQIVLHANYPNPFKTRTAIR